MTLHSRVARVTELIKGEVGRIIDRDVRNPRIPTFVTIHSVKVSRDLSSAQIFVTFLQDEDGPTVELAVAELNRAAGFIRRELSRRVTLKHTPSLKFHYTSSTRRAVELDELLADARRGSTGEVEPGASEE